MKIAGPLILGALVGASIGIGAYTFVYAKGSSYLKNDPAACANCHIMADQYGGWMKSPHHTVATCNDCHAPHNLPGKLATKALNGFRHSFAFTTGRFPDPIQITKHNRSITEHACRHCHGAIVDAIATRGRATPEGHKGGEGLACIRCHASVGHPN